MGLVSGDTLALWGFEEEKKGQHLERPAYPKPRRGPAAQELKKSLSKRMWDFLQPMRETSSVVCWGVKASMLVGDGGSNRKLLFACRDWSCSSSFRLPFWILKLFCYKVETAFVEIQDDEREEDKEEEKGSARRLRGQNKNKTEPR